MAVTRYNHLGSFRQAVSGAFVPLDVETTDQATFRGELRSTVADRVHILQVAATRHSVHRTPELVARSQQPVYKLSMLLEGTGTLVQDHREAVLRPGDLAVYDTDRPYSLTFGEDFRLLVFMFPRTLLNLPASEVSEVTAVTIPGTEGIGAVVSPFFRQLADTVDQVGSAYRSSLAHTAVDLAATMLASALGSGVGASDPHHALVRRICKYIDEHLGEPDLGPTQIAAAHFISNRHLHAIFSKEGLTVSSWIRTRRLEQCRRDLGDVLYADRPVSAIAARWGFTDAAHFSRVFKAEFGVPPSSVRP